MTLIDTMLGKRRSIRRGPLAAFGADEDGATAIEYGLIAALIAVSIIASVTALANNISQTFKDAEVEIKSATG